MSNEEGGKSEWLPSRTWWRQYNWWSHLKFKITTCSMWKPRFSVWQTDIVNVAKSTFDYSWRLNFLSIHRNYSDWCKFELVYLGIHILELLLLQIPLREINFFLELRRCFKIPLLVMSRNCAPMFLYVLLILVPYWWTIELCSYLKPYRRPY